MRYYQMLFLMIMTLCFSSCNLINNESSQPASKEQYLADFGNFVSEVDRNFNHYDKEVWNEKDSVYQLYITEYYQLYQDDLSDKEQELIGGFKVTYNKARAKSVYTDVKKKAKEGVNQIKGAIEKMIE